MSAPMTVMPEGPSFDGWFTEKEVLWPGAVCCDVCVGGCGYCSDWAVAAAAVPCVVVHELALAGQRFSLQVEKPILRERTAYQDVLVFDSKSYGRVMVLDGAIQLTERDEFAYQEMITHLAMFAHPCPKSVRAAHARARARTNMPELIRRLRWQVFIVGGGDGGVLREVVKHEGVERVGGRAPPLGGRAPPRRRCPRALRVADHNVRH